MTTRLWSALGPRLVRDLVRDDIEKIIFGSVTYRLVRDGPRCIRVTRTRAHTHGPQCEGPRTIADQICKSLIQRAFESCSPPGIADQTDRRQAPRAFGSSLGGARCGWERRHIPQGLRVDIEATHRVTA